MTRILGALALLVLAVTLQGCKVGCLGGEDGCKVEQPCQKVKFECTAAEAGPLRAWQISGGGDRTRGTNALAATGDWVLENGFTHVVIAGLGNQNYLDPNGGSLLDLSTLGGNDGVNQVLTVTGVLPGDAAHYTSIEIIDGSPDFVAVQAKGTLDGNLDRPIYTRYELRPCDRGVRMRTEILNASPDTQYWGLADGYYWSKREPIPFTPGEGQGFTHPSFGLTTINGAYQSFPYLAFNQHNGEDCSYAAVSCTDGHLTGFNSDTVSTGGLDKQVVPPRGWLSFERFIAVADGPDIEAAGKLALQVRQQVTEEKFVKLTGKLERMMPAGNFSKEVSGNVLVAEGKMGDAPEKMIPWTQVVPDAQGNFTATVPVDRSYVVSVFANGQKVAAIDKAIDVGSSDMNLGTFTLPGVATVRFEVNEAGTGAPLDSEIFLTPVGETEKTRVQGSFHGQYGQCSPWLGAPPGGSPACNRVLVRQGVAQAEVPAGRFHVYAFHGPFWSLGHQEISIAPGAMTLQFQLTRLPLQPAGAVSADLHVHGAQSFDSMIPDLDRVLSFAASDLDVIIATDHEVVWDYSAVVASLGLSSRMTTVTGVETTGHVPWMRIPNYGFPLVIGHYIFWPLVFDPSQPRNGAPFDEFIEPGTLMTRASERMSTSTGVFQMNHPWAAAEFGRDLGFPRAVFMDLTKDLPAEDDGSDGRGVYVRTPKGSAFANDAHHAQEVMNGSQNDTLLQYRHFWFYVLNQGRYRTGTANSDSHSLVDSTVGMPRNVVYAGTQSGPGFDLDKFNLAVKEGRLIGTSAPIIEATIDGHAFGSTAFKPADGAKLRLKVTTAPWASVPEVRVVVNGKVAKTIAAAAAPADPFGASVHLAYEGEVALSELLAGVTGDAWIVVEASKPLSLAEDLGGGLDNAKDGMPDTTDNNGDGKVDQSDIADGEDFGPLRNPPFPAATDADFHFANVTDNGFPYAFTNPFLLDRNGNGKFDAPGVNGGRP